MSGAAWSPLIQAMKSTAKQIGIILLVSSVLAVAANVVHPRRIPWILDWSNQLEARAADNKIPVIPFAVAQRRVQAETSVFVDARPAGEFFNGHIPGAVSLPFEALDEHGELLIGLIDSGQELIIYCSNRECDDALLLAQELKVIGATNLTLFIDGFDSWNEHGSEVER